MYLYIIFFIVLIFYIERYNKEGYCNQIRDTTNKYNYLIRFIPLIHNERYGRTLSNFNNDSNIVYKYTTILKDKNKLIEKKVRDARENLTLIENRLNSIKNSSKERENKLKEISIKKLFS